MLRSVLLLLNDEDESMKPYIPKIALQSQEERQLLTILIRRCPQIALALTLAQRRTAAFNYTHTTMSTNRIGFMLAQSIDDDGRQQPQKTKHRHQYQIVERICSLLDNGPTIRLA